MADNKVWARFKQHIRPLVNMTPRQVEKMADRGVAQPASWTLEARGDSDFDGGSARLIVQVHSNVVVVDIDADLILNCAKQLRAETAILNRTKQTAKKKGKKP